MEEHEGIIQKQQEPICEIREILQFLIKVLMKNKGESSSKSCCIPRKDKAKRNENESRTPAGSTSSREYEEEDNSSEHMHH